MYRSITHILLVHRENTDELPIYYIFYLHVKLRMKRYSFEEEFTMV